MAEMLEEIDEVIILPMNRPWAAAKQIYEAGRFDLWLDFSQWARIDALLTLAAKSSCKIGFMTPRQYRHYGYDFRVEHRADVHELENYRNLARVVGVCPQALPRLNGNSGIPREDLRPAAASLRRLSHVPRRFQGVYERMAQRKLAGPGALLLRVKDGPWYSPVALGILPGPKPWLKTWAQIIWFTI